MHRPAGGVALLFLFPAQCDQGHVTQWATPPSDVTRRYDLQKGDVTRSRDCRRPRLLSNDFTAFNWSIKSIETRGKNTVKCRNRKIEFKRRQPHLHTLQLICIISEGAPNVNGQCRHAFQYWSTIPKRKNVKIKIAQLFLMSCSSFPLEKNLNKSEFKSERRLLRFGRHLHNESS